MTPCPQRGSASPRITNWSPNVFETMGNDVTLPCVAVGNPTPQVYWVSEQNDLLPSSSADERVKVCMSFLIFYFIHMRT